MGNNPSHFSATSDDLHMVRCDVVLLADVFGQIVQLELPVAAGHVLACLPEANWLLSTWRDRRAALSTKDRRPLDLNGSAVARIVAPRLSPAYRYFLRFQPKRQKRFRVSFRAEVKTSCEVLAQSKTRPEIAAAELNVGAAACVGVR